MGGNNGSEAVFYDFSNDFINAVAQGDGVEVIKGGRVILFGDEGDECGIDGPIHSQWSSSIK